MWSITIGPPSLLNDPSVLFSLVALGGGVIGWAAVRAIDLAIDTIQELVARLRG